MSARCRAIFLAVAFAPVGCSFRLARSAAGGDAHPIAPKAFGGVQRSVCRMSEAAESDSGDSVATPKLAMTRTGVPSNSRAANSNALRLVASSGSSFAKALSFAQVIARNDLSVIDDPPKHAVNRGPSVPETTGSTSATVLTERILKLFPVQSDWNRCDGRSKSAHTIASQIARMNRSLGPKSFGAAAAKAD